MRSFRNPVGLTLAWLAVSVGSLALAHEEQVLLVGRTAAGELHVHMDFAQPVELPVSIFPGIPDFATGELAFHSTVLDEPDEDLFQLSTAADFCFVLLAKDPGMEVLSYGGAGYMATNDTYAMGPSPFDTHPIWNIVSGVPGNVYSVTLKLQDLNGVYPDSDPFVLNFTPVQVRYSLSLKQLDAQHAMLSWPTNAVGWELQSATSVAAINWNTLTNVPSVVGTNFSLNIDTVATRQFFRLSKP